MLPFQSHTYFEMIIKKKKKIEKKIPTLSQNVTGLAPISNSPWFWTLKICSLCNDPTQSLVSKGELKINNLMVGKVYMNGSFKDLNKIFNNNKGLVGKMLSSTWEFGAPRLLLIVLNPQSQEGKVGCRDFLQKNLPGIWFS